MLRLIGISKTYVAGNGNKVKALDNVSVDFGERGLVFVLGKSGSGKSTLLNVAGGLDKPDCGQIIVDGQSVAEFSERELENYRNRYVGFVFQEYNLIMQYTVGENIAIALELQGKAADKAKIDELLKRVELVDENGSTLRSRKASRLSGGQKQRVAIARALIKDPAVILADEPTGALDSKTGQQLYKLLKELSREKLIIVVTHDEESAYKFGDRIIKLSDGKTIDDIIVENEKNSPDKKAVRKDLSQSACDISRKKNGGLPFTRLLQLAVDSLLYKKFRIALSIILSVVTFVLFGICLGVSQIDAVNTELNTLFSQNSRTVLLQSNISDRTFSRQTLDDIYAYCGDCVFAVGTGNINVAAHTVPFFDDNEYYNLAAQPINMFAHVNTDKNYGGLLVPDGRFKNKSKCRLPQNADEIAITDMRADLFMKYGYKYGDGSVSAITSPDDLIGKKLGDFTITGIYSADNGSALIKKYSEKSNLSDRDREIISACRQAIVSFGFVSESFFEDEQTVALCAGLQGDIAQDGRFLRELGNGEDKVAFITPFSSLLSPVEFFAEFMLVPFGVAAAVLALVSALLLTNFLTVSVDSQKREIGILRALGATKGNVATICLSESMLIAVVDFVLSVICTAVFCAVFNAFVELTVLSINFIQTLYIFLLCFGIAVISIIFPLERMLKQQPVDVIDNK